MEIAINMPKNYLTQVIKSVFGRVSEETIQKLEGNDSFNNFVNDVATEVFSVSETTGAFNFTNKVSIYFFSKSRNSQPLPEHRPNRIHKCATRVPTKVSSFG